MLLTFTSECKVQSMYIHTINGVEKFCITMIIPVGSKSDDKKGIAHFVEHMLIKSLKNDNSFLKTYALRATTSCNYTAYTIEGNCSRYNVINAYLYLQRIANGDFLSRKNMMKVRYDIICEYLQKRATCKMRIVSKMCRVLGINESFPIGDLINICTITYKNVREFVSNAYIGIKPEFIFTDDCSCVNIINKHSRIIHLKCITRLVKTRKQRETGSDSIAVCCCKWPQKSMYVLIPNNVIEDTMYYRVVIDYLLAVLEDYIVDFFAEILGDRVKCQVIIKRIRDLPYVHIRIQGFRAFNFYIKELFAYLCRKIKEEFELNRLLMHKHISENNYINLLDWSNELIGNYIYNTPLFDSKVYCECIQALQPEDVINVMSIWFSATHDIQHVLRV